VTTSHPPGITPEELLGLAVSAAAAAGDHLAPRSGAATVTATKSSVTDLVTADDTASERLIREVLRRARPQDGFLGEELGSDDSQAPPGEQQVRWVIDPIDGTVNYVYGLPLWAVSIAAEVDGEVVAGVVDVPLLGRRYTAVRGGGASCNGVPIDSSPCGTLGEALLATGFSYEPARRADQGAAVARLLPVVRDVRRLGAASLDLCLLAAGEVDCYFERGLGEHDRAAGLLIAREAGAVAEVDGDLTWGAAPALAAAFRAALAGAGG
jgi:myo-inositol-1(or 4)-monophosphatase